MSSAPTRASQATPAHDAPGGVSAGDILDAIPEPAYAIDAGGVIVWFNRAAEVLWGRTPTRNVERWCGSWRVYLLDGKPLRPDQTPMAAAVHTGGPLNPDTLVFERPDGSRRTVEVRPRVVRDAGGRPVLGVYLLLDVTETRKFEHARALLAAIVESSDDAIVSKTLEGVITSWNRGAERIFGYTPEEAIGRSITMLIPADRIDEEGQILGRIRRGERVDHFRTVRVTKDGRYLNISLTVSPVRDEAGRLVGASKVARDITAQTQAERALSRSERDLADFFATSSIGLHWVSEDGTILRANQAELDMLGYAAEEYLGQNIARFHADERVAADILARLRRGEVLRDWPSQMRRKDGSVRHVLINSSVLWEDGRFVHTRCFTRDVTEQVEARRAMENQQAMLEAAVRERTRELHESHERLRNAERMAILGTLCAGLGHDMGNLLLPVRLSIETLERAGLPGSLRDDVARIRTAAEYLQRLSSGLRQMAIDPARSPAEPGTDLGAWWHDAAPLLRGILPRHIRLEGELPAGCAVTMSRAGLTQAVFNLVHNASDAMRDQAQGLITISAVPHAGGVRITVRDNGPGMAPEVLARCLDPFFTTKARAMSTGLGLTLVDGLVRSAGGTLAVASQPGQGTTFTLDLPAGAAPSAGAPRIARLRISSPRTRAVLAAELRLRAIRVLADDDRDSPADILITHAPADGAPVVIVVPDSTGPAAARRAVREALAAGPARG